MLLDDQGLQERAARMETLLGEIEALADPNARAKAAEVVQLLLELYGEGLARVMEVIAEGEERERIFEAFAAEFNTERPHEALAMKAPVDVYTPARRRYDGLPDVAYPLHDRDLLVTACGRICMHRKKINLSTVLAGQRVGLKEVDDAIWLVSFMTCDLGYIDLEARTLQPLDNPFGPRLLPMS